MTHPLKESRFFGKFVDSPWYVRPPRQIFFDSRRNFFDSRRNFFTTPLNFFFRRTPMVWTLPIWILKCQLPPGPNNVSIVVKRVIQHLTITISMIRAIKCFFATTISSKKNEVLRSTGMYVVRQGINKVILKQKKNFAWRQELIFLEQTYLFWYFEELFLWS